MTAGRRRDAQRLEDMLKAVREIGQEVGERTRAAYEADQTVQKAVTYDIMILGDAASRVSRRTQKANPLVPWRELADYRNKDGSGPAHGYLGFDLTGTWKFVEGLPQLERRLRKVKPAPESTD